MKKIRKKALISIMILILVSGLLYLFYHNKSDYTSTFFSLDTLVSVRSSENNCDEIKKIITDISGKFDIYSEDSELSLLNSSKSAQCSDELTELLKESERLNSIYGYGVDISSGNLIRLWHDRLQEGRLPEQTEINEYLQYAGKNNIILNGNNAELINGTSVDPGALAKGFALDRVYSFCAETGPEYAVVSTGSTTLLYSSDKERIFRCAVKADRDSIAGTAEITPCFVSTSGDYERFTEIDGVSYHHILDLRTGFPSDTGLSSVTVFCDSGTESDFLSTLIFTEGKDNLDKYLNSDKFRIIAIDKQGNIFKSDSLVFNEMK
ncbi:MAG: FAD:protein FMN transferase [Oscillospiraceae bacterium]|nr:FAD:protein FMN transferase [Oscillospiraceae bacterium]